MAAQITMQCRQGRDQTGPFPGFGILEHTRFFLGVNLIFFDNPKIFTKHLNTTTTTTLRKRGGLMMMMLVCTKNLHDVCEWSWWYKQIQWNARCCYAQDLYDKEEDFSGDEGKICKNHTYKLTLFSSFPQFFPKNPNTIWNFFADLRIVTFLVHIELCRVSFFTKLAFVMFSFRHLYSPPPPMLLNCLM